MPSFLDPEILPKRPINVTLSLDGLKYITTAVYTSFFNFIVYKIMNYKYSWHLQPLNKYSVQKFNFMVYLENKTMSHASTS